MDSKTAAICRLSEIIHGLGSKRTCRWKFVALPGGKKERQGVRTGVYFWRILMSSNILRWCTTVAVLVLVQTPVVSGEQIPQDATEQIKSVLFKQQAAWNNGDIDAFMESYWKSEKLTFSSGGETTRGWQATIDRYKMKYNSRDLMGQLTFSELEVTMLAGDAALALGRWKLERDEPAGGNFSLIFRRLNGVWLIIHDHTSTEE
ncbi:MAG: nuclear transport factor 2 family protein [Pirellulales bacterium]|nr:nuclear transport factor 2 family protein [Pirellulales bacterium]